MCGHTAAAKVFVMAACALAVALSAIGVGVASAWAGSDRPSRLNFTPVSLEVVFPRVHPTDRAQGRIKLVQKYDACHGYAYRRYTHCLADAHDKAERDPHGSARLAEEQYKCSREYENALIAC